MAAAVLLAAAPAAHGRAEITAESETEKGRVTRTVWRDENGNPAAGPEGCAEIRYSYHGSMTEERYYDAEGLPCEGSAGAYGRQVERNGKGLVTSITYLNEKGERAINRLGYSLVAMSYTSFGEVRFLGYYGEQKKLVRVPSLGYASVTTEFSGKSVTRRTWADENGAPVETPMGYAIMRQKLNKSYQVIRTRYEHADGSPAMCADGWSICEQERDGKGRVTKITYYDTLSQLTDRGAGYAWETYDYEKDGVVVSRFALNGDPVQFTQGVDKVRRVIRDDRILSETYLTAAGEKTTDASGVSTVEYDYNEDGSVKAVRRLDPEGNPV